MDLRRLHVGLVGVHLVLLVFCLSQSVLGEEESFGESCLNRFTTGMPDFILDLDDSVKSGATFLSSVRARRGKECVRACCKTPGCNLALAEQSTEGEDLIKSCFLINCLYEQTFVCKFARKEGFLNYVNQEVYNTYIAEREYEEGDRPPIARADTDVRVQPLRSVTLSGIESWDDQGIDSYDWQLISGDPSVVTERKGLDQIEVSNLLQGQYVFQLTVTDTAGQQSSTRVTITVLTAAETEEHCLAPAKVGVCRGSFPRWHYNSNSQACEEFIFGGCKPNKNNYLREQECKLACQDISGPSEPTSRRESPVCDGHCLPSQFQCADGCCIDSSLECDGTPDCADQTDEMYCDKYKDFSILQEIDAPKDTVRCGEFPDTGSCRASFPRWYYDPGSQNCYRFTYGGCPGNENNFLTKDACLTVCDGFSSQDMFGRNIKKQQFSEMASGSVEVAVGVLLGICILVVLTVLGYCILKKRKKSTRRNPPTVNGSTISTTEDTEHLVYNRTTKPV
ncbi:kunitz-type protease inhibitor 1 [Microcaecilia unicolor]|uniref:Kunitz-type protease inhibitor 1 n=1 Tax=Microcaecilia unicolor TaxID=1415580 RepID=A0A6P7YYT5_9AMPH|nr:kunitz-type protease inhibitor 1 [Microcaecilia unicolor]